jgi:DnaJ-class molecular chaperone
VPGESLFILILKWLLERSAERGFEQGADWLFDGARRRRDSTVFTFGSGASDGFTKITFSPPDGTDATWAIVGFGHEDGRPPYITRVHLKRAYRYSMPTGHYRIIALYLTPKLSHDHTPMLVGVGEHYALMPYPSPGLRVPGEKPTRDSIPDLQEALGQSPPIALPPSLSAFLDEQHRPGDGTPSSRRTGHAAPRPPDNRSAPPTQTRRPASASSAPSPNSSRQAPPAGTSKPKASNGDGPAKSRAESRRVTHGRDVNAEAALSFEDAVRGATTPITLRGPDRCDTCRGSGTKPGTASQDCQDCNGNGVVARTRTVTARIPAGVVNGQRLRLPRLGEPGIRGGPAGDLYLLIQVHDDALFGRQDDDVTLTVPISFVEAVNGADLRLPTPHGRPVTLRVPPGTRSGRTLRARGKGVARSDKTSGDLLVTVNIDVPMEVSNDARKAIDEFTAATRSDETREEPMAHPQGDDLTVTVPISFAMAINGADLRVRKPDGSVTLRVPPGTPSGRIFRVRGKGVTGSGTTTGELLVTVNVDVPTKFSDDARKALNRIEAAMPPAPRQHIQERLGQG